jgi:DNA polymerase-3 subunit alpha
VAEFVHLHNHSHYSLLDGLQKVPEMLDRVKEMGMTAVGLTDHGTLSGAVEFYKECQKRGLKPVLGVEAYVAPRGHLDKAGRQDLNPYHLVLLAYNNTGWQNLVKLVSIAHLEGFYMKPRMDRALLEQYHEGLIALSGCAGGEVAEHLRSGNTAAAEDVARWYDATFGRGNYFLELQVHEHQWETQREINDAKIELSRQTGIPLVVTADSHYSRHEHRDAHETLLCVQTGRTLDDKTRMSMDMDLFLSSAEEIAERFARVPEAVENTVKIAERCNVELPLGQILIPTFPVPEEGVSERDYLHRLCWQGLAWRYGGVPRADTTKLTEEQVRELVEPRYAERLEYELGVIARMGYDGYFLITADFINWGKDHGIIFGPGRGSAAGSIVAYTLNITTLDPIKYNLLFERFLNPDRISMPDIDIDIMDSRRGEVIDYTVEKYGADRVAQIITFGTMAARSAVRDTGRVLGYPIPEVDRLAKLVPEPVQGRHVPLAVLLGLKPGKGDQKPDPDLTNEYRTNLRAKTLLDLAMQLEGTIRSNGVHAAGVVITPGPVMDYAPLQRAQKGLPCVQFEWTVAVDDLGLLKMDFLGLSNLTIINNALRIIRKVYGQNIDLDALPLDDPKTYELLSRGDTTGVFQFESSGMKRYLRELKPTVFDDVSAMGGLYRPGPLSAGLTDSFMRRKNGLEPVTYDHPSMENALKPTYGVLVYQEQVMQIARDMCGFTGGQADTLRKGVAKKRPEVLAKMKTEFIEGAIKTSQADPKMLEEFWGKLEGFAAYCFPKAHAVCYGLTSYQTAYLKAHYPAAFMAALMTSDYGDTDRIAIEIAECRHLGNAVLPPDVNESFGEFAVVPGTDNVRFGMNAVKNVGVGAVEAIVRAREEGGRFVSVEDFAKRVSARECNRKGWESLAKCGAFDSLIGGDRALLLHNLDLVVAYAQRAQKNALSGQIDIFGSLGEEDMPALRLDPPPAPATTREQLAWERDLLGLYLSAHPLDDYAAWLEDNCRPVSLITPEADGRTGKVGGIITTVRKILTKNGATMAFVGLEDRTGTTEIIVFPKAYELTPDLFEVDKVIWASGKVSARDREGKLTGDAKLLAEKVGLVDYETAKGYQNKAEAGPKPGSGDTRGGGPDARAASASTGGVPEVAGPEPGLPEARPEPGPPIAAITITLVDPSDQTLLLKIKDLLVAHPGSAEVFALLGVDQPKKIRLPFKVDGSARDDLNKLLGAHLVKTDAGA